MPAEVLANVRRKIHSASIATVYRNIRLLVEEGWLESVKTCGGAPRYERSGKDHHHHFQCDDYGRLFDLPGCWLPRELQLLQDS